jgi:phosphoribosylglycinamide formyltransferase 1
MGGRVAVLVSGGGTNLQALLDDPQVAPHIALVLSDRPHVRALERATARDVAVEVVEVDGHPDRDTYTEAVRDVLLTHGIDTVVLAGFMRVLSARFFDAFPGRVLNVHPALLPAFPGLDPIGEALAYGVKVFGVTVHFVDEGVDSGAVILQRAIELPEATDRDEVHDRLRPIEHELLTEAIRLIARGAVRIDGRRVRLAR